MKRAFYFILFLLSSTILSAQGQYVTGFPNTTYPAEPGSGYALAFDGINDFVGVPDDDDLSFGDGVNDQSFTLSAWVNVKPLALGLGTQTIFSKSSGGNYEYQLSLENGILTATVRDASLGGNVSVRANTLFPYSEWVHVAMTYDGSGNAAGISLYINGQDRSGFPNSFGSYVAMENGTGSFSIGSLGGVGFYTEMKMDEVRVWSTELGIDTIRNWMTKKINPTHPNIGSLVAYYRFDDGSGAVLEDLTGGNNGAIVNMTPTPGWESSGAPLGDRSVFTYLTPTLTTTLTNGSQVNLTNFTAADGIHLYRVTDTAVGSTYPLGLSRIDSVEYFGVFSGGSGSFDVEIDYSSNSNINEQAFRAIERSGGDDSFWNLATGFLETNSLTNTITILNETRGEYTTASINSSYRVRAGSGYALAVDGIDDFIDIATSPLAGQSNAEPLTIDYWVKTTSPLIRTSNSTWSEGINGARVGTGIEDGRPIFSISDEISAGIRVQGLVGTEINDGKWHHIAYTYDGSKLVSGLQIYVDGSQIGTTVSQSNAFATRTYDSTLNLLGSFPQGTYYEGTFDEMRFWHSELSVNLIREWMTKKINFSHDSILRLAGYYRFDIASGSTVENLVDQSTGALTNMNALDWVQSGAALGDQSVFTYGGVSLSNTLANNNQINLSNFSTADGIHLYTVKDTAFGSSYPGNVNSIDSNEYFGVFKIGNGNYDVEIDYSANTSINGQANELSIRGLMRKGGDDSTWAIASGALRTNTTNNSISILNQVGSEYVTGFDNNIYPDQPGSGYALNFDGVDDYLEIPNEELFDVSSTISISAWVKMNSLTGNQTVVTKGDTLGSNSYSIQVINGLPQFLIYQGPIPRVATSTLRLDSGKWHHISGVLDGARMFIYVDGVVRGIRNAPVIVNNSSSTVKIGAYPSLNQYFNGTIDEVSIWNIALSVAQLRSGLTRKVTRVYPQFNNLIAHYKFDENSGAGLKDLVGGNNGTFVSTPQWVTSGAALGDSAVNTYPPSAISINGVNKIAGISNITGSAAGIHLYYVKDTANNVDKPAGIDSLLTNNGYFGTFIAEGTTLNHDINVRYIADPFDNLLEYEANLVVRESNADLWRQSALQNRTSDTSLNNVDAVGFSQRTEFTLASGANNALNFTGTNGYVNVPHNPLLNMTGAFTVELYVKATGTTNEVILEKNQNSGFSIQRLAGGRWAMNVNNGFIASSTISQNDGNWHHLAIIYDGFGGGDVYIDGVNATGQINPNISDLSTGDLNFGGRGGAAGSFEGSIDEVRIWNRALCHTEILFNINCENPGNKRDLVAHYGFNNGSANFENSGVDSLFDLSGNGLNGALIGITLNGDSSNWVAGSDRVVGSCGTFIGPSVTVTLSLYNNIVCNGQTNASVKAIPTTTDSSLTYLWSNGGMTDSIANLGAGQYFVTVTGSCGEIAIDSVTITEPLPLTATVSSTTNVSCTGGSDGEAAVSPAGGTSPYFYLWSNFADTDTIINLTEGNYLLTLTDANGCSLVDSAFVPTTVDVTNPTVLAQGTTVYLDGSGMAMISPTDVDNGSFDNCSSLNLSVDISNFTCAEIGANSVILTGTDADLNSSTANSTVTVLDTTSPVISAQNITVYLNGSGNTSIVASDVDNGSADNCGTTNLAINISSFNCANVGANSVTLRATDGSSNTSEATSIVTVLDTTSPIATAQNITVYLDGAGNASILPLDIDNGSADNCGAPNLSLDISSFNCSNVGANNVILTATDGSSNSSNATAIVTVLDTISAIASTQDITVYLDGSGNATITPANIDNGSTDNCGTTNLSINISSFTCADIGANNVTLTATDANSNISTAVAVVTVLDTTSPVLAVQNFNVYLDGSGNASITPADVNNGSSDNCGTLNLSIDISSFTCANVGVNTVNFTATDGSSNSSTSTALVTVFDTISPIATAQNITVYLDGTGNVSIISADVDNGSTDNCGVPTLTISASAFTCANIGANNLTLTATDGSSNSSNAVAVVTVLDTLRPIVVTQPVTVFLDAAGNASIATTDVDNSTSDNCGVPILSLSKSTFSCVDPGPNTVQLIAIDVNGNIDSASAIVTVNDTTPPSAVVQNITAYLDGTGNVSILPADVDNGSADNCGVPTLTLSNNTFTCANIGINNVTLTAADGSSNIATATAIVNVVDTTSPAASAQNISVYLDVSGSATITAADIDNGSADNCSFVNLSVNTDTFDCTDVGANSVILTVIDGNGNNSSATSTVTVLDTIKPIVITRNISVNLNNAGVDTITALDIDNGSFSNCGPVSLSLDSTIFDCSEVGPNTVTLIVTDANGNVDSATAIVTVIDSWRVSAFAQDITVYLDNLGQVTIDSLAIDAGSSDNCSIDRASLSQSTFNCSDIGGNSVEMLLIDPSGNRDSATAIVTVLDTTRPNVITQNINVYIDGQGFASINPSEVDNGSSDNCSAVTLSLDTSFFDCADIGANTVTLTVTDGSSNASSGTAIVTVIDTISPIAVAQNISVVLNASGIATIVAGDIDNGSSDNCSTLTLSVDSTTFDCSEIGVNTVVLTTTDGSNNTSTATVTVTVSDTSSPIAVAQNLFAYLDATGNVTIAAADVNNGSLDNCVSPTLSIDVSSFTCADIGPNTVTLTVTDGGSNFSTANSIVTVEDTISPVVIPQNIDIYLNRLGVASITPTQVDNGSSDNCSNVILSIDSSNFDCSEVGLNTVILTARDVNGNTSSAQAIVTIRDSISRTSSIQETSCGAYTWTQTGLTYSATGLYYDTIPTALGCDSILELDLTINNIGRDTVPVTSCNSYVWLSNNITYTSSGVYSDTLSGQASNGCDSIASIDLTIDVATVATDLQTACDSLVWIDGITYFTSNNTATFTIPNAVGCDSVITLDLTINNATSSTVTEGACGSFTWAQNGLSYLTTGLHNDTILNAAGCDSIVTLDLTINQPTASTLTETACETYTWVRNGETYTTSGNYNDTVPNAVGCDSVITLDLTINQSTASSFSITSCDTYNWALSGVTYTISGSYNDTIPNAVGCDSVLTLILTIDRSTVANAGEDQSICDIDLAVLSANSPINGSGTWSVLSGSGSFNNLNNPNTTVTGITQGLNQYTWSIVNGVCPIGVDTVIVSKANNPIVDAGPDQTIFQLDGAVLEATSNIDNVIGVMYSWEPAFYLSSNSSRVAETNSFLEETTEFMVQVTSPEGCVGSDRLVVNINELLTFSAAFTPNGDGKNDLWLIKNIQNPKILSHKVTIFDSYGSELFRSTNFQGWDGTYNGNALPVSSYYYSVEIKFADGESRVETGLVTILR